MSRHAAIGLGGLAVALALARLGLAIADPASSDASSGADVPGGGVPVAAFEAAVLALLGAIGTVVATRVPRNPVGWLLSITAVALGALVLSSHAYWSVALRRGEDVEPAAWIAWLASWIWIPAMVAALILFPLLFPTGRAPTRRWDRVRWTAAFAAAAMFLGEAFGPGGFEDYPAVDNPVGFGGTPVEVLGGIGFAVFAGSMLAAIASLVVRFRRSRGDERQQLKWVTAAAALFVVIFAFPAEQLFGEDVGFATLLVGFLVMSSAVAVAMLRHRLYDIDVLINRTLVYATLSALLAGAYLGSVLLLQLVLSPSSDLAIAGSTLAVAALVRPGRTRIQAAVDRRFFRSRYDAQRTLATFGVRLRDEVSLDALSDELREVVGETMRPASVSLWLRGPS